MIGKKAGSSNAWKSYVVSPFNFLQKYVYNIYNYNKFTRNMEHLTYKEIIDDIEHL